MIEEGGPKGSVPMEDSSIIDITRRNVGWRIGGGVWPVFGHEARTKFARSSAGRNAGEGRVGDEGMNGAGDHEGITEGQK